MTNERGGKKFLNYDPDAAFHTFDKLKMYAKPPGESKQSSLVWGCWNGNPRITVNTNIESDKVNKNGMITAAFNPETFFIFLEYLKIVADSPNETTYKFECKTTTELSEGGRSEPFVASSVWIGKDNEGKVWLSILIENRPKVKFIFMISNFHTIHEKGKGPISEDMASVLQAKACAKLLEQAFFKLVLDYKSKTSNKFKKDSNETTSSSTPTSSDMSFDDITM